MATTYKTPGVYINEVSTLPASVAQVETAIPAIVGYTEYAKKLDGSTLKNVPKRIKSMVEFQQFFGGAASAVGTFGSGSSTKPTIILDDENGHKVSSVAIKMKYFLYHSMVAYFANGGGPCYIVSVGGYDYSRTNATIKTEIETGIDKIALEDEPTILLSPDASVLTATNLGSIQQKILQQCNKLQDRFGVFDLIETASSNNVGEANFRLRIGTQYLKYGAAYGPWLETTMKHNLQLNDLHIEIKSVPGNYTSGMLNGTAKGNVNAAFADLTAIQLEVVKTYIKNYKDTDSVTKPNLVTKVTILKTLATDIRGLLGTVTNTDVLAKVLEIVQSGGRLETIIRQARAYDEAYPSAALGVFGDSDFDGSTVTLPVGMVAGDFDYDLTTGITADPSVYGGGATHKPRVVSSTPFFLALLEDAYELLQEIETESLRVVALLETALIGSDSIYAGIQRAIAQNGVVVPPSAIVAGIYAATDANRGVWKAPANVSLSNVVKPTIKIDNLTQEGLNVSTDGKSINIIRSFTGKGVLVWGARTLAGNDNEWRYVPVRRLFITMEESIKKATEFVVFEPNDSNTWLRTKNMIENYLTGLWRQGALAGAKPDDAFFVNVGLGQTMTSQDILEGRMIVEIGVAAVRPAEFIILRFSHKLQES